MLKKVGKVVGSVIAWVLVIPSITLCIIALVLISVAGLLDKEFSITLE